MKPRNWSAVDSLPSGKERPVLSAPQVQAKLRKLLSKSERTIEELADSLSLPPKDIRTALDVLRSTGYIVRLQPDGHARMGDIAPGGRIVHRLADYRSGNRVFGACGDNHLGSKHERIDVLNALYDLYAAEGVTEVYNTGNWIEGEKGKLNFHDISVFGMDAQVDYFIKVYPRRKGITTFFVAGDDHEGWYQQREAVEIGRYAMLRAQQSGRQDLVYLGYGEADVELKAKRGSRIMRVVHPGGGSAYALSYSLQKLVESYQGGEKPAVVLAGHYHKFDHNYYREVHIVQAGTTCDQSVFMRKQKIQAHVGGCLIRLNQAPDGRITRFAVEWVPFYDRGYYVKKVA